MDRGVVQGHFLFYNERQCVVKGKDRKRELKCTEELAVKQERCKFSELVL